MLFLYSFASAPLGKKVLEQSISPHDSKGKITLFVQQRYFSIFFIPIIPLGKKYTYVCSTTGKEIKKKELSSENKYIIDQEKKLFSTPRKYFIGLAIIVFCIGALFIRAHQVNKQEKAYFQEPLVGDTYVFKQEDGWYVYGIIESIEQDQINFFLTENAYENYSKLDFSQADKHLFTQSLYTIPKSELREFYENNEISKIYR